MDHAPSRRERRLLARENIAWPVALKEIAEADWPDGLRNLKRKPIRALRSRDYLVQVYQEENGIIRLSALRTQWDVNANSWTAGIRWEDLQRLKSEAGYGDRDAVEVFPPDSDVINVANLRHLWVLPEKLAFAWRNR